MGLWRLMLNLSEACGLRRWGSRPWRRCRVSLLSSIRCMGTWRESRGGVGCEERKWDGKGSESWIRWLVVDDGVLV